MDPIAQWNCRGLNINFIQIALLAQVFLSIVGFFISDNITLKKYSLYNAHIDKDERDTGG